MTHFMNEEQSEEARSVAPTENAGVDSQRNQHGQGGPADFPELQKAEC